MHAVPTRRLLVYVAVGLVVLVAGTAGLLSLREDSAEAGDGLVIEGGGVGSVPGGAETASAAEVGEEAAITAASTTCASPTTTETPRIWVQVAGAVRRPGVYQVPAGARVFEAVSEAGGFNEDADQEAVALAAELADGCRVYVPRTGEVAEGEFELPGQSSLGIAGSAPPGGSAAGAKGSGGLVSLNSAGLEELDSLPGIGPALAQRIISYREANGPFTSVDQLLEVPGIGPAKLEELRPLVEL